MVIANILGVTLFFYLLWRILKDDYHYERIFNLGFIGIISLLIFYFISSFLNPTFWFWTVIVGIMLGFFLTVKKQKMKFFETFEGFFISFIPWTGLFYLSDSVIKLSLSSFLIFWMASVCIFIYFYISTHYRSFSWYKSGRVGIAGIISLFIFFVSRTAIFYANNIELIFSGSAALLLLVLLYNLFKENDK